ncbi:phosphate/phosphite/phosphonate ABC transporter substrate-binding protein [Alkalimarinus alittae]|uniref:Phosphate/phosphite/phosphonate ABC transporter substrate-binding protein n=1 Tax=Alkalimarinus alittae TaxID=2961619 RepID=A0ABY6N1Q0_9ALTE|nr:phosphate/phosphite/phosphonate ABC transporter substrate-binding protein [Alkalimarinus alittae]UZE96035.1 phosphate/phosphite/phosphonate ABC transporter substrate-binding protein [Alkalimarinus alittae]
MFSIIALKLTPFFRRASAFALLALLLLGVPSVALCQDKFTIYFYDPEVNTTRNVVLKMVFDQYLKEKGQFQFQPVDNKRTFESLIQNDPNAIFMISNWHFNQLKEQPLTASPVLRGIKNGSDTYRKFLVVKNADADIETMTIATSGTAPFSRSILADVYPQHTPSQLAKPKLLLVPKDIDALMAVGFGLADAALASELSLETLSTLYKNQRQQLHIVGNSRPLKRLLVVRHNSPSPTKAEAIDALHDMSKSSKGLQALNTLGLNGWQSLDERLDEDGRPAQ